MQTKPRYSLDLKARREAMRMTQAEFAARAGISESCYQRVEAGEYNVSLRILRQIAIAMRCTVEVRMVDSK